MWFKDKKTVVSCVMIRKTCSVGGLNTFKVLFFSMTNPTQNTLHGILMLNVMSYVSREQVRSRLFIPGSRKEA
jgi:hypothetical protein